MEAVTLAQRAHALCLAIEALPAGEQQTALSVLASELLAALAAPKAHKREVALVWIERLWRDLSPEEKALTTAGLNNIPWDNYCGSIEHLLERYERREVGCMQLTETDGKTVAAASFFEIVELVDGSLCFESLCTVAVGPTGRNLTKEDMQTMEDLAWSIRQGDKVVESMAMRTPRHGLAEMLVKHRGWYASEITLRKFRPK